MTVQNTYGKPGTNEDQSHAVWFAVTGLSDKSEAIALKDELQGVVADALQGRGKLFAGTVQVYVLEKRFGLSTMSPVDSPDENG